MPWLFYNSPILEAREILCIGQNSNAFTSYLKSEGKADGIHSSSSLFDTKSLNKYDLVIGARLESLYEGLDRIRIIKQVYTLVKSGKKFIFTAPVKIRGNFADLSFLKEVLHETGFELFRAATRLSLLSYQLNIEALSDPGKMGDIAIQNGETLAGIVLYKPFDLHSALGKRFQIKRSWLHANDENEIIIIDYVGLINEIDKIGLFDDIMYRKFWFPDGLLGESGFTREDLSGQFNMDALDAVDLINEMFCMGCLVEI